jgi:hypothetical protein
MLSEVPYMKTTQRLVVAVTFGLLSSVALAAKPTSITYVKEVPVGEEIYAEYVVKCSDGTDKNISTWDNRKSWCQGTGLKEDCDRKQIEAAKKACK